MKIKLFSLSIIAAFAASFCSGAEYYITPSGGPLSPQDGSDWDYAYPKSQLFTVLNTTMGPGDTLFVGSGTYTDTTIRIDSDGTAALPKTITGVDTGSGIPHFNGTSSWTRSSPNSGLDWLIFVTADHWVVENLEFSRTKHAIKSSSSSTSNYITFRDLYIHDVRHGTYIRNLDNSEFENVVIQHYTKQGFRLDSGCDNVTFTNCLADMSAGDDSWWDFGEPDVFGFVVFDGGTANTNIDFVDCVAKNNLRNGQTAFWQGDGFVSEANTVGITFTRCIAINNEDAGFDLKQTTGSTMTLTDCVAVGNSNNFKIWKGTANLDNCVSVYPRRRSNNSTNNDINSLRITDNATVTVDSCSFLNGTGSERVIRTNNGASATVTNSILAFDIVPDPAKEQSFTNGSVTLGTGTETYYPGSGTDPDFINPSSTWDGYEDDMNSQTYGSSKGYYVGATGMQFDAVDFSDYSSQSGSGSFALESDDTAIHLTGNTWRKVALNYTVTAETVLRVTVNATNTGELIAMGFDTNNDFNDSLSSNVKIGGSQATPTTFVAVNQFYTAGSGAVTYDIPVGLYFTGSMSYLTFIADDDDDSNADVVFSGIDIFEQAEFDSLVFDSAGFIDYATQTGGGSIALESNGQAIHLTGNIWRRYAMNTTITADTVLELTVNAPDTGEIIGIGFDTNNSYGDSMTNFRLGGSQGAGSSFNDITPTYTSGEGAVTYVIPVGSYYTGSMTYMTFIADDDTTSAPVDVTFSNIKIYESPLFDVSNFSVYTSQTSTGTVSVGAGGASVTLTGNTWRKHPYTYTVTADTMLEVTIDASNTGEIIGVGLDNNNAFDDVLTNFKLGGSQAETGDYVVGVTNGYTSGEGAVTYVIPVGAYFTGSMNYITFIGDDDASANVNATFSDVRLYEAY